MKATIAKTIVVATLAVALSACGNHQTNRRVGTGAAIGGLAGYVLGGDTQSAVGGAALGSIAGVITIAMNIAATIAITSMMTTISPK